MKNKVLFANSVEFYVGHKFFKFTNFQSFLSFLQMIFLNKIYISRNKSIFSDIFSCLEQLYVILRQGAFNLSLSWWLLVKKSREPEGIKGQSQC